MKRYYEGAYGFIHDINKCRNCEYIYTWHITSNGIPLKRKEYSCFIYNPYIGTIKDINKIASFCKLSKDKDNCTTRKEVRKYIKLNKWGKKK